MATTERLAYGATAERLRARLASGRATVGIIGLGYAGLPMAVAFAEAGLPTIGVEERGLNALWSDGGLQYAPPYR